MAFWDGGRVLAGAGVQCWFIGGRVFLQGAGVEGFGCGQCCRFGPGGCGCCEEKSDLLRVKYSFPFCGCCDDDTLARSSVVPAATLPDAHVQPPEPPTVRLFTPDGDWACAETS